MSKTLIFISVLWVVLVVAWNLTGISTYAFCTGVITVCFFLELINIRVNG